MARLNTSGAEGAVASMETVSLNSASIVSTAPRTGTYHFRLSSANVGVSVNTTSTNGRTYFCRGYIKVSDLPVSDNGIRLLEWVSGGTGLSAAVDLGNDGALNVIGASGTEIAPAGTIAAGVWYRYESSIVINTAADDTFAFRLEGTELYNQTYAITNTLSSLNCRLGFQVSGTRDVDVDDVAMNDDQGSDQNSWPGPGRVVMLKPISDNARTTQWTGGVGGTTNLWDAVDNLPPTGTASETDTSQIEHSGGTAGAYDANLTSYATAGMGPYDTVTLVAMTASDGEDVATGTKTIAYSMVSNPAISTPGSVSAGDDGGALGTWPTGWANRKLGAVGTAGAGGPTYNPSVTLATSPVMRVNRPGTESRVASVCFMGLLVEYRSNDSRRLLQVDQAINRSASF